MGGSNTMEKRTGGINKGRGRAREASMEGWRRGEEDEKEENGDGET